MTVENTPSIWLSAMPWPSGDTHKHARGRLGVVSGGPFSTGAARLAARAGLRAGAGLVRIMCPQEAAPVIAPAIEAIMLSAFSTPEALEQLVQPMDALVIGPAAGVGDATRDNIHAVVRAGAALILDADVFTVFQGREAELFAALDHDDVLTPHEAEFERLFPGLLAQGRPEAAARAAQAARAVVVLKGAQTVIAAPDGRLRINRHSAPWLATAGSGDVLAGIIGSLIAQRMDSFDAASAAVWMHGDAARRFGPGLIAEDLPDLLPKVLSGLYEAREGEEDSSSSSQ